MPIEKRWREYGTARYKRQRAALLAGGPPCFWGCGRIATTADHHPSLEEVGHWHWSLVPACVKCNLGRHGKIPQPRVDTPSRDWL